MRAASAAPSAAPGPGWTRPRAGPRARPPGSRRIPRGPCRGGADRAGAGGGGCALSGFLPRRKAAHGVLIAERSRIGADLFGVGRREKVTADGCTAAVGG